jgi:MoaA/NifB/PqqE/SkfB family radical SAM enzyme
MVATRLERHETTLMRMEATGKNFNPLKGCYKVLIPEALRLALKNPSLPAFLVRTVRAQKKAFELRSRHAEEGLSVPPVMVFSVTNSCNLHCKGCYNRALRDASKPDMSTIELTSIIQEGAELGVSLVVFVGGEPLVRQDVLEISARFPDVLFMIFTNGTLITDEMVKTFRSQKNVLPVLSIEGNALETDGRRGVGVYQQVKRAMEMMRSKGVFFGSSITVTRDNFHTVVNDAFVRGMTRQGCRFMLYSEYTPTEPETDGLAITETQRELLGSDVKRYRAKQRALFFVAPGDETQFGGCLSAGRGFIHINANGDAEPCPFVPVSDINLRDRSLREALLSPLFAAIRAARSEAGTGGCTLWNKREWLQTLAKDGGRPSGETVSQHRTFVSVAGGHGDYYRVIRRTTSSACCAAAA